MKRRLLQPSIARPDTSYVTIRKNKRGGIRIYWIRAGKTVRLTTGPEHVLQADRLNKEFLSQQKISHIEDGSVGWAIATYRQSDAYKELAPSSRSLYERWLKEFEGMWGFMSCAAITRKAVKTFARTFGDKRATRILAMAVLGNVLGVAYDEGIIDGNPVSKLKLSKNAPRQEIWDNDQIAAFMTAADRHPKAIQARRYFSLLQYTGQRPSDCVKMTKAQHNGDTIKVRQQKTGKFVEIPCHQSLRDELAEDRFPNSLYLLAQSNGKPFTRNHMGAVFRQICTEAQLDALQARDLRRTAAVRLGEAGCTGIEISAITGHSLDETQRILETYVPRTLKMARNALAKWENKPGAVSNALDDKGR